MTRTSPFMLATVLLVAGVVSFIADSVAVGNGRAALLMPWAAGAVLCVIGVALVVAAWPVRQAVRGAATVTSVHATRVLGAAKASSIVGALVTGWAGGILVFLLSRPVLSSGSIAPAIIATAGAAVLLAAALLAESWCVLPPDDEASAEA